MGITIRQFLKRFPDDNTCLEHLFRVRYGDEPTCRKCERPGKFYKLKGQPAYSCEWCGHHIHPMAGTFMHRSHVAIRDWFYAMYLFTTTRHGVPAKKIERQLGVTYRTALRITHKIRQYMAAVDGDDSLSGHVEVDETMIGGRRSGGKRGRGAPGKTVVFGMLERAGDVITRVVANVWRKTLEAHVLENIKMGSTISSDELGSYRALARHGYRHGTVNHSADKWVRGDVTFM